jgi:DNA-directed RNA polymerase specialized sigma24 family protein
MQGTFDQPERVQPALRERQKVTRQLSQEAIDKLVSAYLTSVPTTQLVQEFNLGKGTVLRILRDAGVTMRRQGLPDDQLLEAAALYESGVSLAKIAERYGVSTKNVHTRPRAAGVGMRDSHGRER